MDGSAVGIELLVGCACVDRLQSLRSAGKRSLRDSERVVNEDEDAEVVDTG
jgi:hypothetical protein